ncbi:MAG: hypothetical protein ACUVRK_04610 [Spirochaetota bacterium]
MMKSQIRAILLFLVMLCFAVLIFGYMIQKEKVPIPDLLIIHDGSTVLTLKNMLDGQNYYFSGGGHHIGTIGGHGSSLAPCWSADYLHRLGLYLAACHYGLDQEKAKNFTQQDCNNLDEVQKAKLEALVTQEIKKNRYNAQKNVLVAATDKAGSW